MQKPEVEREIDDQTALCQAAQKACKEKPPNRGWPGPEQWRATPGRIVWEGRIQAAGASRAICFCIIVKPLPIPACVCVVNMKMGSGLPSVSGSAHSNPDIDGLHRLTRATSIDDFGLLPGLGNVLQCGGRDSFGKASCRQPKTG